MRIRITYQDGLRQEFDVVEQDDFEAMMSEVKVLVKEGKTKEAKQVESEFKSKYGDKFCTTSSPIFKSLESQVLSLPETQGGDHPVQTQLIQ